MRLIDTHCHVHFQAYKDDMDEVVKRSLEAGVQIITVGTQSTTSANGILLAEKYDGVWATIGLHPNHVHRQSFFDDNELPPEKQETGIIKTRSEHFDPDYYKTLVTHPKVVAIGEFGLDYYRLPPNVDLEQLKSDQKTECKKQLLFASEYEKPIVIHCRDAHDDQFAILKEIVDAGGLKKHGVIHSFTGTLEDAKRYDSIGFKLGINGILFFSKELQAVVKETPLEQLVVETDSPYLTPPPNRGKRNDPTSVRFIVEKIAELKSLPVEEVAYITTANAETVFGLK